MKASRLISGFAAAAATILLTSGCHRDPRVQAKDALESRSGFYKKAQTVSVQQMPGTLVALPRPKGGRFVKAVAKGLVSARFGSVQTLGYSYIAVDGKDVHITATLYFPPEAVSEDTVITVRMDNSSLAVKFEPEGIIFRRPGQLVVSATGLDLSAMSAGVPISLYDRGEDGAGRRLMTSRTWARPTCGWLVSYGNQIQQSSQYVLAANLQ
jgi:hypothetical protein